MQVRVAATKAPVLPAVQRSFTLAEALQAWIEHNRRSIVRHAHRIEAARRVLLEDGGAVMDASNTEILIRDEAAAREVLNVAHNVLSGRHRDMARFLYSQVAKFYADRGAATIGATEVHAHVQTAKMIIVDHQNAGAVSAKDGAAALASLEWASAAGSEEARLWLKFYHGFRWRARMLQSQQRRLDDEQRNK